MKVDKTLIKIPFMGFYNSLLDSEIDNCIRNDSEYQEQEGDKPIPASEFSELVYRFADFGQCHNDIAKKYVDHFENLINETFDISISLEFESMESPREYNFTTDSIFCYIAESDVDVLMAQCNQGDLQRTINDHLKSRSGFISFYSEFVNGWQEKPLNTWDCNELSMLLYCMVDEIEDMDLSIYYGMNEDVYMAYQNCVDWKRVDEGIDEYLTEKEED